MSARVLYFDDNASNVKLMRMVLSMRADLELSVASNGSQGLSAAFEEPPDIILVDLYLPDLRGDEVLRRLKSNPDTAGVPAVVVSAENDEKLKREAADAGAVAYVTKPFDVQELLALIDRLLASSVAPKGP